MVLKVLQKYKAWLSDLQEQEWQSEVSNRNPPSFILLPTSQVLLPQTNEEKKKQGADVMAFINSSCFFNVHTTLLLLVKGSNLIYDWTILHLWKQ